MTKYPKILLGKDETKHSDLVRYLIKRGIAFESATQIGKIYVSNMLPIDNKYYLIRYEHFGDDLEVLETVVGVSEGMDDLDLKTYRKARGIAQERTRNGKLELEDLVRLTEIPALARS